MLTSRACDADRSTHAEHDACFGRVVRRHLHTHHVTYNESDETLAHFARDVSQNLVTIAHLYLEHRSGQNGGNGSFNLNRLIFATLRTFANSWPRIGTWP